MAFAHTQLMFVIEKHLAPQSRHVAEWTAALYRLKQYDVDQLSGTFGQHAHMCVLTCAGQERGVRSSSGPTAVCMVVTRAGFQQQQGSGQPQHSCLAPNPFLPKPVLQGPAGHQGGVCRGLCTATAETSTYSTRASTLTGDHIHSCSYSVCLGKLCCGGPQHAGQCRYHCQSDEGPGRQAQVPALCVYFSLRL